MKMFLIFAIAFLLSVLLSLIFFFMWKIESQKARKLSHSLEIEKAWTERLKKRCDLLEAENKAKTKNQEVANERLKMLHNGNSFANACAVLQNG